MKNYRISVRNDQRADFLVRADSAEAATAAFAKYGDDNAGYLDVLDQSPNQSIEISAPVQLATMPEQTFNVWDDGTDIVDVIENEEGLGTYTDGKLSGVYPTQGAKLLFKAMDAYASNPDEKVESLLYDLSTTLDAQPKAQTALMRSFCLVLNTIANLFYPFLHYKFEIANIVGDACFEFVDGVAANLNFYAHVDDDRVTFSIDEDGPRMTTIPTAYEICEAKHPWASQE